MKAGQALVLGLAMVGLSACGTSDIVEDRYYSLVLAAGPAGDGADDGAAHLVVGPVELPRYLGGRGLSMQVGPNRIETANHHFWAEALDEAIAKVLVRDIAERTDQFIVERQSGRWTGDADCRVRIEFDAFHPTHQSRVAVSGRYWIVVDGSSTPEGFSLPGRLTADGYGHAVDVLRDSLADLAAQIASDLPSASECGPDSVEAESADQS